MSLDVALRGRSIAKQRVDYLRDLERSGRWSKFYGEEDFRIKLREATEDLEGWEALVRESRSSKEPGTETSS
jgi:hypothetical protein